MSQTSVEELRSFSQRPTVAEIDLAALRFNIRALKGLVGPVKMMASIKANGYGHGLVAVARLMQNEGVEALGVAYIEEAMELRRCEVTIPILVFGGLPREQLELYITHDVDITASSVTKLEQIEETAKRMGKRARAHLKIDTGFERIGVHYYSAQTLFDAALKVQHVDIVGVYSHFADVNADDMTLTNLQLERFLEALAYYEARATQPFVRHIASSAGLMVSKATHLDMVRPGLALYGVYPGRGYEGIVSLKPVLSLKSQVVYFKVVKKGAGVSYGHTWHAPEDTRVITIPIGYGDGYLRQLSNKASVIVRGHRCPIVGVICMDQLMVDIGRGEAYNTDEVVLIGRQGDSVVTVEELAALIETTPHQILVSLNERIPRVYLDSDRT
jgi:alanine racemase